MIQLRLRKSCDFLGFEWGGKKSGEVRGVKIKGFTV